MHYEELVNSPIYSIFIFYSDIQIIYKDKVSCSKPDNFTLTSTINSFSSFNISFINQKYPRCYDTTKFTDIYEKKKRLFDYAELTVESSSKQNLQSLGLLDTLAFSPTRLDEANVIRIYNKSDLYNFEQIFAAKKILNQVANENKYLDEIDMIMRGYSRMPGISNNNTNSTTNIDSDQFNLIDSSVTDILISSYFLNQDLDKLGVVIHKFSSPLDGVNTEINNYSLEVHPLDHRESLSLDAVYFIIIIILIIFAYLKYAATEDLNDSVNKNLFLILTVLIFLFENVFKFYHLLKGTNNAFFSTTLVYKIESRDRYFFYLENIKVFKGMEIVTVCFHFIYILFTQKDLMILKKLFKRVIIVFFIVLFFLIFSLTIFMHLVFGEKYQGFASIISPLFSLFTFVLGVETGEQITENSQSSSLIIKIMLYFIRLAVVNFTLIVMILVYKRFQEKEEIARELQKKMKARGK